MNITVIRIKDHQYMQSRLHGIIMSFIVSIVTYSQEIDVTLQPDTIAFENEALPTPFISPRVYSSLYNPKSLYDASSLSLHDQRLELSPYFFDQSAVMPHIANLGGYVTSTSLPGLMGIESGALSYTLASDNISFTPSVYVNKYGYYGGLTTSLGVGGQISFRINERFSINAFGSYHNNSWSANPAVMSNMHSSCFGGYATWDINDRWGLNVGAQRVYNSAINQWQTVPILMPTFKINGKNAIAIDVGGLLYEIVDWNRNKNAYIQGNPTIGPPVKPQIVIPPHE